MRYETLLAKAAQLGIDIYEKPLSPQTKGLYADHVIWINKDLSNTEKGCILAEELGHYYTSSGDILDQRDLRNRKQELRARSWAYEQLVPLSRIAEAHREGIRHRHELADFLNVTEPFLAEALTRYQEKYGKYASLDGYTICFDPLGVIENL